MSEVGSVLVEQHVFSKNLDRLLSHPTSQKVLKAVNFIENVASPKLTEAERQYVLPSKVVSNEVPRNTTEAVVTGVLEKMQDKTLDLDLLDPHYVYRMAAVFSDHENPNDLDPSLYPTGEQVGSFINWLKSQENKLTIPDQMEKLLEICDSNIVEAAKLGMMSFRIIARNLDKKLYPDIAMESVSRDLCDSKLLPFVNGDQPQDVLGDHYYFYTSMLTRFVSVSPPNKLFDEHSAQIMSFTRRFIANQPVVANHMVAFKLGKDVASQILEQHKENSNQASSLV